MMLPFANSDFLTQVQASPVMFVSGILVWIPIAAWTIAMIQWMIMGEIDVLFGLGGIALALTLGYLTVRPPDPRLSPICLGGVVAMVIFFPIIQRGLQKRELVKMDIERIEDLYENLSFRPDNISAIYRLAEVLWHRGIHAHALGLAESVMPKMTPALFRAEHLQVSQWRHQMGANVSAKGIKCLQCGKMVTPGGYVCPNCKAPYLLLYARTSWLGPSIGRRILGSWILAIVILVGIPTTASLGLPRPVLILCVIAEMAIGLIVMLGSFHDRARA